MGKLICGKNSLLDAIKGQLPIRKIYISNSLGIKVDSSIEVIIKSKKELDMMTNLNHQGYIAEIADIHYYSFDELMNDKPARVIILDHIQDPHNFGAIIRTANVFGIKHIIIPKDRAVSVTDTVLKIASGGIVSMKIIKVSSISSIVTKLKKGGFWIYGTAIENGLNIDQISFNYPLALIFGNEGSGVSKPLLKMSDQNIFIKMSGTVQSLNVSVAAGVIIFKTRNE
ncbi:23S rRNA (guanosine(2251)-2'-O)-methyltransferase RlmB [Candidatus Mycoplasma mahonii]|uniref:23S rRNA (guanosine(2251)-2'-O)-methyltransferase RlmB n=1 Tax=Candidatus Mycoplasma mahonii TaxID=3004105 RepID=UPI0026F1264B|nr:23S rRNA (guanosine(2251)-2'-O)-methyltransferase RlmB [Candidatus Mycoplasma mahonii]WKX02649.1 23S rRNA (guanosine(2251)-2'-O)-methyltransferase RlmB [Candidatus Mycoplasma mahonii]